MKIDIDSNSCLKKEICDALGLKKTISLKLTLDIDSLTILETVSYVETEKLKKIIPILKKYRLEEIK
jgi:hypothetical protein